jgi:GGDEF domain-containing protein
VPRKSAIASAIVMRFFGVRPLPWRRSSKASRTRSERERRFQQAQNRYRARLRTVRRHGELFVELERTRRSQAQVAEQLRALDDRQAELQQQARFWRNEALRDPVSGALNRRGLAQSAQRLLLLDRPAALALIRLEHFAALMDSQGQAVVDEVVSQTALLLANSVRQGDLLARSRVDEFCLVMMPSDEAYARMIGQPIRSTIDGVLHAPECNPYRPEPFKTASDVIDYYDYMLRNEAHVAAIIVEPVVGTNGVLVPPDDYFPRLRALCDKYGALLIADEVQSGIGRAGYPLYCHHLGVVPDLVTVGKGLGGGFPVAALLLTERMAATVQPSEHGTTFGGGPLAAAAVESTLQIIEEEGLLGKALALGERMRSKLAGPAVRAIRGSGVWIGLQLDRPAKPVAAALLERRFIVGTSSDPTVLRLCPPAVLPTYAVDLLAEALAEVTR